MKVEDSCYVCGDSVPKKTKLAALKSWAAPPLSKAAFVAGLAYIAYVFFGQHQLPLPVTVAISSALLPIGILAQRIACRKSN